MSFTIWVNEINKNFKRDCNEKIFNICDIGKDIGLRYFVGFSYATCFFDGKFEEALMMLKNMNDLKTLSSRLLIENFFVSFSPLYPFISILHKLEFEEVVKFVKIFKKKGVFLSDKVSLSLPLSKSSLNESFDERVISFVPKQLDDLSIQEINLLMDSINSLRVVEYFENFSLKNGLLSDGYEILSLYDKQNNIDEKIIKYLIADL